MNGYTWLIGEKEPLVFTAIMDTTRSQPMRLLLLAMAWKSYAVFCAKKVRGVRLYAANVVQFATFISAQIAVINIHVPAVIHRPFHVASAIRPQIHVTSFCCVHKAGVSSPYRCASASSCWSSCSQSSNERVW